MASLLIPNLASLTLSLPATHARASFKPPHVPTLPVTRRTRGLTVVTRAGPSTSSYVFATVLPLSLLAGTIFVSIRIADKLDSDFLEELAINQAIRGGEDEDEDEDENENDGEDEEISLEEVQEPVLSRTRNRPKREV